MLNDEYIRLYSDTTTYIALHLLIMQKHLLHIELRMQIDSISA